MVLLYKLVNQLYEVEAPLYSPSPQIGPNYMEDLFHFKITSTIALVLTWCSLVAVKFCYLALFKKLVDRIRPMIIYWWTVMVFNAAVSAYGVTVYMVACPYYHSFKAGKHHSYPICFAGLRVTKDYTVQCGEGAGLTRTVGFAVSQMVLDVVGDFMSKTSFI